LTALAAKDCSVILSMEMVQRSLSPPVDDLSHIFTTPVPTSTPLNDSLLNTSNNDINTTTEIKSILLDAPSYASSLTSHLSPPNSMNASRPLSQSQILIRQSVETSGICISSSSFDSNSSSHSTSSIPFLESRIPVNSPLPVPYALPLLPPIKYLAYSIGVVDIGPKPGSKIRDRMDKGEHICSIVSIVESYLDQS
jgi:hypothetical protein